MVIGKDGYIHGKVECVNADIEGNFNGELQVSDLLSLKSSAVIEGTVTVAKLSVEPGATFNASCSMSGKGGLGSSNATGSMNSGNKVVGSSSNGAPASSGTDSYKSAVRGSSNESAKAS